MVASGENIQAKLLFNYLDTNIMKMMKFQANVGGTGGTD